MALAEDTVGRMSLRSCFIRFFIYAFIWWMVSSNGHLIDIDKECSGVGFWLVEEEKAKFFYVA
ncbi:hypothetical protein KU73_18980 [Pectobacterium wasabiae]|uniref:Uncharacterized protein n=1 Tax=Pectobacterium wasabiae TaxID=55208 RepID=A0AAW3ED31_9GAMM|nr:hypothetical protein A7983_07195 [Pectobacterium wasabiae CFBP 3304]KFX03707.1 hypothetical protein JV38_18985 [Pectobacterium wasabiae]KGA27058.1 hypothetical protein KU73_18980 [Pectobacterium wasabiae]